LSTSTASYEIGTLASADGTEIGYRSLGNGPGVILLGGYTAAQHSQHYMGLAESLSGSFTVYVPDRIPKQRFLTPEGVYWEILDYERRHPVDRTDRPPAAGLPARRL
jgi:hypothetical protein